MVLDRDRLAFTLNEATDLLRTIHGSAPTRATSGRGRRAEGWPAALTLLAQAVGSRGLPALEGTPREVFEYLATVVLEELPAQLREFALRTSVLFEITPALCRSMSEFRTRPSPSPRSSGGTSSSLAWTKRARGSAIISSSASSSPASGHGRARHGAELHRRAGRHLEDTARAIKR